MFAYFFLSSKNNYINYVKELILITQFLSLSSNLIKLEASMCKI